jgi:hypothetical protein
MTRRIESKFWIGDTVFQKNAEGAGPVTAVQASGHPTHPVIIYGVTWPEDRDGSRHYEIELTAEQTFAGTPAPEEK